MGDAQTSDWGDEYLDSKKEHLLRIIMLDVQGRPLPGRERGARLGLQDHLLLLLFRH